jgi:hypothetical protein
MWRDPHLCARVVSRFLHQLLHARLHLVLQPCCSKGGQRKEGGSVGRERVKPLCATPGFEGLSNSSARLTDDFREYLAAHEGACYVSAVVARLGA